MIARYCRPEMEALWNDRHRYLTWLKVEMAVCRELAKQKAIPSKDWAELQRQVARLEKKGGVDPKRVEEHEAVTRHDVIAFTTAVAEQVGPTSRYIHFGLTSSDVVDTALSLVALEAGELLVADVKRLLATLKRLAKQYRGLPTIGRSHGIFAEPTSFGLKFLGWYCEWERNLVRLESAIADLRFGKLSGAVGVNAHWAPEFEEKVLEQLGLQREPVATQVIPRDRHVHFISTLALCGASLERIAVELRHLQRSEVAEVREGFAKGQKGSSAMPHKRNPISSENITGAARLLRGYAMAEFENVPLWHERDISHSSVERIVFPDTTLLLDYALHRMNWVLENLVVDEDRVKQNLEAAGPTVYSGHYLLELVRVGATREEAYAWVQQCAMAALGGEGDFVDLLAAHPEVAKRLPERKIHALGASRHQLRNVAGIFKRAFAPPKRARAATRRRKAVKK